VSDVRFPHVVYANGCYPIAAFRHRREAELFCDLVTGREIANRGPEASARYRYATADVRVDTRALPDLS